MSEHWAADPVTSVLMTEDWLTDDECCPECGGNEPEIVYIRHGVAVVTCGLCGFGTPGTDDPDV